MKKTIEHIWSVLCEKSIIDSETNNISLNNVIEELRLTPPKDSKITDSGEKSISFSFEVITLWKRLVDGEINKESRLDLVDPDGKILASVSQSIKLNPSIQRLRSRVRLNGLKVTVPGYYIFSVKIKEDGVYREVGKTYLEVKFVLQKNI